MATSRWRTLVTRLLALAVGGVGLWLIVTAASTLLAADDPTPLPEQTWAHVDLDEVPVVVDEVDDLLAGANYPSGVPVDPALDHGQPGITTVRSTATRTGVDSTAGVPARAGAPMTAGAPTTSDEATTTSDGATTGDATTSDADDGPVASSEYPRLVVPALRIDTIVFTTDINSRNYLTIPGDARLVTMWAGGAAPGDPTGTVVIAGHVNTRSVRRGALYPLHQMRRGALIEIVDPDGTVHEYRATGLDYLHKEALPADYFTSEGPARLLLITCGGEIGDDGTGRIHYLYNVVVTAEPV